MDWSTPFQDCDIPIHADDAKNETVVVLAHGAGSHMDQKTVLWLAKIIRDTGATPVTFNFMYRVKGKGMPDRMPTLISAYRAVIDSVRERLQPQVLMIGGHSMGGRAASMLEAETQTADGLLLFGYPLHPAEQPEKLRDAHLPKIKTKTIQVNGTEDPLCTKQLMDPIAASLDSQIWTLKWIEGADHSYAVKKSSGRSKTDVEAEIRLAITSWLPKEG